MRLIPNSPTVRPFARVLYVDDYPDVANAAVLLLGLCGFDARAAYDGLSALSVAATFLTEVCFLDLKMPRMEGDELAVKLREQSGDRAVLLVCVASVTRVGHSA